jgi:hypothetical protein
MRGRIRQLKPELFLDDEFWALQEQHPELPLLQGFLGLWCQADREGRFEWKPAMLKTQVLPYWGGDFGRVLDALHQAGLLLSCEVDGRRYGAIRSFARHQRPNNREPRSCIPDPLEHAQAASVSVHEPRGEAAEAPRASRPRPPHPTPDPDPEAQVRPPEVPGLRVVAQLPAPGGLLPSRREQDLTAKAEALTAGNLPRHEYTPGWTPVKANQVRGHELGLSDEEIWARWETVRDKHYAQRFRSDVKQFNRELAFAAQDKTTKGFQPRRAERAAFELPGRERRA